MRTKINKTFEEFEYFFKQCYFILWYDALAKRNSNESAKWMFYYNGVEFDFTPVEKVESAQYFDKSHLCYFDINYNNKIIVSKKDQWKRTFDFLQPDEIRNILVKRYELSDKYVEELDEKVLEYVIENYFEAFKYTFNEIIREMFDRFKFSSEYTVFIYQIKDMFEFKEYKK